MIERFLRTKPLISLWIALGVSKMLAGLILEASLSSFLCAPLLHIESYVPSVGLPLVQLTTGGSKVLVLWFVSGRGIV